MIEAFREARQLAARSLPARLQWLGRSCSRDELAGTAGFLDALFGVLGELLGSDDGETLGELAFSEHLEVALGKA